jgi:hypothetical protein
MNNEKANKPLHASPGNHEKRLVREDSDASTHRRHHFKQALLIIGLFTGKKMLRAP